MASGDASERGHVAERAAARKYGLEGVGEETGYYDLTAANGCRYQVKSATHTRSNDGPGKFRFWREHFVTLADEQSAVILVLTASDSPRVLKVEKVPTGEVREAVGGEWYPSGHADEGEQYKVPWPDLLTFR